MPDDVTFDQLYMHDRDMNEVSIDLLQRRVTIVVDDIDIMSKENPIWYPGIDLPTIKDGRLIFENCDEIAITPQGVVYRSRILDWTQSETQLGSKFEIYVAGSSAAHKTTVVARSFRLEQGELPGNTRVWNAGKSTVDLVTQFNSLSLRRRIVQSIRHDLMVGSTEVLIGRASPGDQEVTGNAADRIRLDSEVRLIFWNTGELTLSPEGTMVKGEILNCHAQHLVLPSYIERRPYQFDFVLSGDPSPQQLRIEAEDMDVVLEPQ
jgi:hypothetical protein